MKKLISLVLALAMILMVGAAFASTITITPPANTDAAAENTYNLYKIFDAVVNADDPTIVSYKLPEGVTAPPAGFTVDAGGNVSYSGSGTELTDADIAAIKQYITANSLAPVDTKTVTGTAVADFGDVGAGYYYIDTTTGTAVSIKTNNENLALTDKNTVPTSDKVISDASGTIDDDGKKAISEVGKNVKYTVTITVGKGMLEYKLHDTMSTGLSFNNDMTFTYAPAAPTGYAAPTVRTGAQADEGDTVTVDFADGLPEGTVITAVYSAKVTNEALTYIPEKNTAKVEYANGPTHGFTPKTETETYSAKIGVNKVNGSKNDAPLAGAGFKLYKLDGTTKLYYNYDASTKTVTWDSDGDERVTKDDGSIDPFLGLNDGTYYLEESTVPDGFNAPGEDTKVEIKGKDYTQANLEQTKTIQNNQGAVLPGTGGIGTTIFYIVGGLLLVGAAIILVARRKANN